MPNSFASRLPSRRSLAPGFRIFVCVALFLLAAACIHAQAAATQVTDATALKPPAGARVAIVEFADLECPACAHANPILKMAAAKYKIPWIRHDYLIPYHTWSLKAAVTARRLDALGKGVGDEYRDEVFANQSMIYNPEMLREFTSKFAQNRGITLPFDLDPQGKLNAAVLADNDLGKRTGVKVTPTIFIVTANSKGAPFIEVRNLDRDLYQTIDQALADTKPAPKHTGSK